MNRIAKALNEIIRKEKKTVYGIGKAVGVDTSSLYRALKNGGNLGAKTIDKILGYLGYDIRLVKSRKKEVVKSGKAKSRKGRR